MQEIIVAANEAGQRLDKMLAKYLNEAPKSFLYKMLRKKNIVLNGKKATGNEKLAVGDSVKLFLADETIVKFSNIHAVHTNVTLDIIYEDESVLLINKPVGMLSQKAAVMGKISTAPTVSASRRMKYCGMVNFQNSVIL